MACKGRLFEDGVHSLCQSCFRIYCDFSKKLYRTHCSVLPYPTATPAAYSGLLIEYSQLSSVSGDSLAICHLPLAKLLKFLPTLGFPWNLWVVLDEIFCYSSMRTSFRKVFVPDCIYSNFPLKIIPQIFNGTLVWRLNLTLYNNHSLTSLDMTTIMLHNRSQIFRIQPTLNCLSDPKMFNFLSSVNIRFCQKTPLAQVLC